MNIIRRAFAVLALSIAMVSAQAAEISTLTGKKYLGDIASINDGIVTFRTEAAGNIGRRQGYVRRRFPIQNRSGG